MSAAGWSKGAPPRVGVYVASYELSEDMRRYWDGQRWSAPWSSDAPAANVERCRSRRGERQRGIQWRELQD